MYRSFEKPENAGRMNELTGGLEATENPDVEIIQAKRQQTQLEPLLVNGRLMNPEKRMNNPLTKEFPVTVGLFQYLSGSDLLGNRWLAFMASGTERLSISVRWGVRILTLLNYWL